MAKLSRADRKAFDKMNSTAAAYGLGKQLDNAMGCVRGTYDFSLQGGAVGDFNLLAADSDFVSTTSGLVASGNTSLKIPSGCIIIGGFVHVITAFTSGGAATMDLNIEAANDGLAASAVAGWTAGANLILIPDFATVADYLRTTAERTVSMSVNTAALTAGKANFFIFYVQRV